MHQKCIKCASKVHQTCIKNGSKCIRFLLGSWSPWSFFLKTCMQRVQLHNWLNVCIVSSKVQGVHVYEMFIGASLGKVQWV